MTKKKGPPAPRMAAVPVVDPDLPEKARKLLRDAEKDPRRYSSGRLSPLWAAAPVGVRGGAGTAGGALLWWISGSVQVYDPKTDDLPSDSASDLFGKTLQSVFDAVHSGFTAVVPLAAAGVLLLTGLRAWEVAGYNATLDRLTEARNRCVRPSELAEEARTLLARAQQAKTTVLASSVHRFDLIDRQRNEMALPQQEWEIAEALREYTRLVKAEPKNPRGDKVAALLGTRRKALKTSLDGIARRVTALESYADQVTAADDRYKELQQIHQLAEGGGDVLDLLDLLARTVRDDLAVAEIEGMTGEAAAVATTFTSALESAKEAAVIALPAARKTA
ncbi:hypothetical protein [Streptomyces phaeochromogenes]